MYIDEHFILILLQKMWLIHLFLLYSRQKTIILSVVKNYFYVFSFILINYILKYFVDDDIVIQLHGNN